MIIIFILKAKNNSYCFEHARFSPFVLWSTFKTYSNQEMIHLA